MRQIFIGILFISIHITTLNGQISAYYSIPVNDGYSSTLTAFVEEFVADDFGHQCLHNICK